jgi:hypothetical protein
MSSKLTRTLIAALVTIGLVLSVSAIPSSLALAASPGGKSQTKDESAKKPGKDCEQLKKDSKEYKTCVTKHAQSDKKGKGGKKQSTD